MLIIRRSEGAELVVRLVLTLNSVCVSIVFPPTFHQSLNFLRSFSPKTSIVDSNVFEGPSCRCEYPGEDYYREELVDYVTIDDVKILPPSHDACQDVSFVCPGHETNSSVVWSYDCSELAESGENRRAQLRGQRSLKAIKRHEYSTLLSTLRSPQQVVLPSENEACAPSISCTDKQLTFAKASGGRPLAGGFLVHDEFLDNYGVKITAKSQNDSSKIVRPMLFDTENARSNGMEIPEIYSLGSPNQDCAAEASGIGDGGKLGELGQNCEPLGNVLIAKKVALPTEEDQYGGILTFEFDNEIEVLYEIGLLNILGIDSSITFYQDDGSSMTTPLESVGQNGLLILRSNIRNVKKIVVNMRSFSAVTHLNFCSNGP
jgi:hypothetical protein